VLVFDYYRTAAAEIPIASDRHRCRRRELLQWPLGPITRILQKSARCPLRPPPLSSVAFESRTNQNSKIGLNSVKLEQIDWKQDSVKKKYWIDVSQRSIENKKDVA
jgi:hypothetical protein